MILEDELARFAAQHGFNDRGQLNVGLIVTDRARKDGLPLDPERLLSPSGGQVAGLSGAAGDRILRRHGVTRSIGTEAGRTSRGSIQNMRSYVAKLNELDAAGLLDDLERVERFWAGQVVALFDREPLTVRSDPAASVQAVVSDVLAQAQARQREGGGAMVIGTVLQHLVGAKLDLALAGRAQVKHHGANTSDEGRGRGGDFDIGDAAIHVTASPTDALLAKCARNLGEGARPMIVTTRKGAQVAHFHAEQHGIAERVEVIEVEQFIAANMHELGLFEAAATGANVRRLIERYNELIEAHQNDPSLKIDLGVRTKGKG